jgi:hypothetical protein
LKTGLIIGFILTGLLVIAWPMGVFASIFLFDAPIHSDQDEAVRYGAAGSILFYPVIWGVALAAAIKTLKKQKLRQCAAWIAAPILWLFVPISLLGVWSSPSRTGLQDKISDQTSFQDLATDKRGLNFRVRVKAYNVLGREAVRLPEPDKQQALLLLIGGLSDPELAVQTESAIGLGALGPYAEAAIPKLIELARRSPMAIESLAAVGKAHPSLVLPELIRLAHSSSDNGWRSVNAATMAVSALGTYRDQADQIVRAIKDCSDVASANFLGVWLTTMTTLDPHSTYYDPAILERPIVTVLKADRASYFVKFKALEALAASNKITPIERECVASVAERGGTPRLRAAAQEILDCAAKQ